MISPGFVRTRDKAIRDQARRMEILEIVMQWSFRISRESARIQDLINVSFRTPRGVRNPLSRSMTGSMDWEEGVL